MKKIISLVLVSCFALAACGDNLPAPCKPGDTTSKCKR